MHVLLQLCEGLQLALEVEDSSTFSPVPPGESEFSKNLLFLC